MHTCLQVGAHTFTVTSSSAGAVAAINNPMVLQVFQAATAADASGFAVDMANPAAGANATLTVYLRDRFGAPLPSAAGVVVTIRGEQAVPCCRSQLSWLLLAEFSIILASTFSQPWPSLVQLARLAGSMFNHSIIEPATSQQQAPGHACFLACAC